MSNQSKLENTTGHGGFEREDLQVSTVLYFFLGLGVALLLCIVGLRGVFAFLNHREKALQPPVNPLLTNVPSDTRKLPVDYRDYLKENFPDPRLEIDERNQLDDQRLREERELYSYGWVDEKAGTVRIPIDRAMDLIVQRGLPVRAQAAAAAPTSKKDGKKGEKK
jgi:hypothetical protein